VKIYVVPLKELVKGTLENISFNTDLQWSMMSPFTKKPMKNRK